MSLPDNHIILFFFSAATVKYNRLNQWFPNCVSLAVRRCVADVRGNLYNI